MEVRRRLRWSFIPVSALCLFAVTTSPASADEDAATAGRLWQIRGGTTTVTFDAQALAPADLRLGGSAAFGDVLPESPERRLAVRRSSSLTFSVIDGSVGEVVGGSILHLGDITLETPGGPLVFGDLAIAPVPEEGFSASWVAMPVRGGEGFTLGRVKAGFDAASSTLTIRSAELRLAPPVAASLGDARLAETVIGSVTIRASVRAISDLAGEIEGPPDAGERDSADVPVAVGPDMTFCQLYGLYMPTGSRVDDVVGLAVATTSWNIGDADLMWFPMPNEEHPFIVMNLYRLKDGRFEQIGQSDIKHGFYALGSHQCGGPACSYEPGHGPGNWLGTGCTDTYSASLNAVQSGMGPKYEVNPWTGYWDFATSHMVGSHGHDAVHHRIKVHDDDLDPALNVGATYYAEGYYAIIDDVDVMNSASWKEVTVSGTPGGHWSFGMSGSGTFPNIGFAIDAWAGARQAFVAQELPVVEFVSPDGRCILSSMYTTLTETSWRYEYAMLNIDMDRQVGRLTIPIPPGTRVSNVGFHAVEGDDPFNTKDADAVPIDNAPWTITVSEDSVTWETTSNPLCWGQLYNFWFDATAVRSVTSATVGLFRQGTPGELSAEILGPTYPVCFEDTNGSGSVDVSYLLAVLGGWGTPAGDVTGDGTTDVADILAVLGAWGPCP